MECSTSKPCICIRRFMLPNPCEAGKYSTTTFEPCTDCPAGFEAQNEGNSACTPLCPEEQITLQQGWEETTVPGNTRCEPDWGAAGLGGNHISRQGGTMEHATIEDRINACANKCSEILTFGTQNYFVSFQLDYLNGPCTCYNFDCATSFVYQQYEDSLYRFFKRDDRFNIEDCSAD